LWGVDGWGISDCDGGDRRYCTDSAAAMSELRPVRNRHRICRTDISVGPILVAGSVVRQRPFQQNKKTQKGTNDNLHIA
jgi:hypothetical protein